MKLVEQLAYDFRKAIEKAKEMEEFKSDCVFRRFPHGCCGDTSYLLAEYLLENGIRTMYVCGTYAEGGFENMQSHAWLTTDDGDIVDITGDQFKDTSIFLNYNKSVYVGKMDDFHTLFEVEKRDVHEMLGLSRVSEFCYGRLKLLYNLIIGNL